MKRHRMLRLFVVGCPRSGTTLLQALLTAHSDIVSFKESHLFDKGFKALGFGRYAVRSSFRRLLTQFAESNEIGPPRFEMKGKSPFALAGAVFDWMDEAAHSKGASTWVEKTPDHVFRLPLITVADPAARFVHIVRRADAVLPSLHTASRLWGNPKSWIGCALHWARALAVSYRSLGKSSHYIVIYERLLADPEKEMRALFAWLKLPWQESIIQRHAAVAGRLIGEGETWKAVRLEIAERATSSGDMIPLHARLLTRALGKYDALVRRLGPTLGASLV